MADQNPEETPHIDQETLESLQQALYTRLREPLFSEVRERLLQEAAEKPIPLYYDRFVSSETQRLEESIDRNGHRITELRREMHRRFAEAKEEREQLRAEMNQRFAGAKEEREQLRAEMNQRFEHIEQRFDQLTASMRNWALAAVAIITVVVTILSFTLR
ncbi:MAG: hypothetical protein ACE5F6_02025 [Anaerolineae bacterium]